MPSQEDWKRLGEQLIRRRVLLDRRFRKRRVFAEECGVNWRLVSDIESARRTNFGQAVLAELEIAYRLAPGSMERFLVGGELVAGEADQRQPADPAMAAAEHLRATPGASNAEIDAYLAVLDAFTPVRDGARRHGT
jgi:hypothetical protein